MKTTSKYLTRVYGNKFINSSGIITQIFEFMTNNPNHKWCIVTRNGDLDIYYTENILGFDIISISSDYFDDHIEYAVNADAMKIINNFTHN